MPTSFVHINPMKLLKVISACVLMMLSIANYGMAESPIGPAQRLLDKLAVAKTEQEANFLYEDIIAAWLASGGPTVDILLERGVDAQESSNHSLARDMYDRVILIEPEIAETWYRRGVLFFEQGKYDEAILDFEEALDLEPRHFEAWLGLGAIFEAIEEREAALNAYRQVLKLYPYSRYAKQAVSRLEPLIEGRAL